MAFFSLILLIFIISIAGLAIGVIFGRTPIKGSCGTANCSKRFECTGCNKQKIKGHE